MKKLSICGSYNDAISYSDTRDMASQVRDDYLITNWKHVEGNGGGLQLLIRNVAARAE